MSDTPETDKEMRDVWLKSDDSCVETWAEKNGDTIDVVDADFSRRLERQRDAYAETLRQTLVLLDTTPSIERPLILADIIRERHPELAQEGEKGQQS